MAKRRYTDDERAACLAALAANGGNTFRTSQQVGVPETTLRQWAKGHRHPEAAQMSEEKKEPLADRLVQIASQLADGLDDPEKIKVAPLNQIATAFGIVFDKNQLLRGQPTQIQAGGLNVNLTRLTDAQLAELDAVLAAAEEPPAPEPGQGRNGTPATR